MPRTVSRSHFVPTYRAQKRRTLLIGEVQELVAGDSDDADAAGRGGNEAGSEGYYGVGVVVG